MPKRDRMCADVRGLTTRGQISDNSTLRAGGGVAQLGEHHVRNVGVEGSIPFSSTILRSFGVPDGAHRSTKREVGPTFFYTNRRQVEVAILPSPPR